MTNNKGLKGQQDRQAYVYMDTGKPGTGLKRESRAAMKSRKPTMRAAEQGLGTAKG